MFDDFQPSSSSREARKRVGGSVLVAATLYGTLGALIIGTTTAATKKVVEEMTQVEFAPPPPPPPPPPPAPAPAEAKPVVNARPKVKRKALKPPDEVPKEKLKESNADLAAADETGPTDGFLNGVEGGTGTAAATPPPPPPPPPKPEPLIPPVASKSNEAPKYSASAKRKEIEGVVVVSYEVLEDGSVANVKIVSGPEDLRENVLKTVATWHFQPARRGGKPVRLRQTMSIRFRLSDA